MIAADFFSEAARFWAKVDRTGECWNWLGEKNNHGYGRFAFWQDGRRERVLAHRMALALTGTPLAPDMVSRHTCDNPACVRPDHIVGGTQAENVSDAAERGRLDLHGLTAEIFKVCRTCGVAFRGRPNRRYCDEHQPGRRKDAS